MYLRSFTSNASPQQVMTKDVLRTRKLALLIKKGIGYSTNNMQQTSASVGCGISVLFNNHHHTLHPPHPLPLHPRHKRQNSLFGLVLRVPRS
jgi:hypothetical protein